MKNAYYIFLCLISALCSIYVNAQVGFYSKSDLSALEELPEKWIKHWNSHNIDSLSSLLQTDADLVTVRGTLLKGKTNFIKDHSPKFLTIFKGSVLSKDTVLIRYVKSDMAIIHFGWGIRGDLDWQGNKQDLRHGIGTWVVIKEMNDWKILISHMMLKLSAISTR